MIYSELLLAHARHPRHQDRLAAPAVVASAHNPACGDLVALELALDGGRVAAVCVAVRGCAVATAAGSLAGDVILGRDLAELRGLTERWLQALADPTQGPDALPAALDPTRPLLSLRDRPARLRCASLPWDALSVALRSRPEPSPPRLP